MPEVPSTSHHPLFPRTTADKKKQTVVVSLSLKRTCSSGETTQGFFFYLKINHNICKKSARHIYSLKYYPVSTKRYGANTINIPLRRIHLSVENVNFLSNYTYHTAIMLSPY
jgi:hypothetical protein